MSTRLAATLVALGLIGFTCLICLICPAAAWAQVGGDAPVEPVRPPSAVPEAPEVTPDAALERVLRTGCHDGLSDVARLVGRPDALWADTVLRLCHDILARPVAKPARPTSGRTPTTGTPAEAGVEARRERSLEPEGRGQLVLASSLYGIWLGVATDLFFGIDGDRSVIVAPLLGMATGLSLSLAVTSRVRLTSGQAWTIITGLDYGSYHGALWAGSLDFSYAGTAGTTVASSIAATTVAIAVADAKRPSAGTIELMRSSLMWGTIGGTLGLAAFGSDSSISEEGALRTVALTMDVSFLIGLALAREVTISRNRVLIIDAGALGGGMTGLGLAWLAASNPDDALEFIAAGGLVGMLAGIGVAAYATRNIDAEDDENETTAATVPPSLFALHPDGRWRVGTPGPSPVFDGTGRRIVGATLNALSGTF